MVCRIDTNWAYCAIPAVRLENPFLALTVLPGRGANILEIFDKSRDRNVLWRADRMQPKPVRLKDDFDDHWAGGWDDIFPTGRPCENADGDKLPYLGELWSMPHEAEVSENGPARVALTTSLNTPITPARFKRTITLSDDDPRMVVDYSIKNTGTRSFAFQWGIHPVFDVSENSVVNFSASHVEVDEWLGGALGIKGDQYKWPMLGKTDMRQPMLGPEQALGLHYAKLEDHNGWFTLDDSDGQVALRYDAAVFPCLWYLVNRGASRGYSHIAIEPWTSAPSGLDQEPVFGKTIYLEPGETLETQVSLVTSTDKQIVRTLFNQQLS